MQGVQQEQPEQSRITDETTGDRRPGLVMTTLSLWSVIGLVAGAVGLVDSVGDVALTVAAAVGLVAVLEALSRLIDRIRARRASDRTERPS